jgi:hypothetical protein
MTGILHVLVAGGGSGPSPYTLVLSDVLSGLHRAAAAWNQDGSINVSGNGSSATPSRWYTPPGGSPGALHWIKFTKISGTDPTGVTMGAVVALNVARVLTWDRGTSGTTQAQIKAEIFNNAAGTAPARSTVTFNVTVTA